MLSQFKRFLGVNRSDAQPTGPAAAPLRDARDGRGLLDFVSADTLAEIQSHLANPKVLFQMQFARMHVAKDRSVALMRRSINKAQTTDAVIFNAVDYNLEAARTAPMLDRPMLMTNVVSSIGFVHSRIAELDVLSIGPRSEIELFGMIGAGFSADRLRAIDLFSYSPLIDAGDMHAMPYSDGSFDVVFANWVLQYSKDQKRAAAEIMRVARPRAIVAVAADHSPIQNDTFCGENTHLSCVADILALFAGHIDTVFFQHEPELPNLNMVAAVIRVKA